MKTKINKKCVICNKDILVKNRTKYCSWECAGQGTMKNAGREHSKLTTASMGALSELLAAGDLLKRGYEVYRSVSPSCSGDLMVEKNRTFLKIEVRTAHRHLRTKNITFSESCIRSPIVALVLLKENLIFYLSYPQRKKIDL